MNSTGARILTASLVLAAGVSHAAPGGPAAKPEPGPGVAVQLYVWMQVLGSKGQRIEDHLDEVLGEAKGAGYTALEGWLSWFSSDEKARDVAETAKRHGMKIISVYQGGAFHEAEAAKASIEQTLQWARRARRAGVRYVDVNPNPKAGGARKTDEELAVQARALNDLGRRLREIGMRLVLHHHSPEMADEAREYRHLLKHTSPKLVGICMDVHWVYRGGQDVFALLEETGPRAELFHLRNSRGGVWTEELGDGDIDMRRLAKALRAGKFSGWLIVELAYEGKTKRTRTLAENQARSRAYVREVFGR